MIGYRFADLEAMGFTDQANVGENSWAKIWMARPHTPVESAALPARFQIRPLMSEDEVAAYVTLHRLSSKVTA